VIDAFGAEGGLESGGLSDLPWAHDDLDERCFLLDSVPDQTDEASFKLLHMKSLQKIIRLLSVLNKSYRQ
jgi:hypothetical protein